MKYAVCSLLVLCVSCNKHSEDAAQARTQPAAEAASVHTPNPVPTQAAPQTGEAQQLDVSKAKAFVDYQNRLMPVGAILVKGDDRMNKNAKAGKYEGSLGSIKAGNDLGQTTGAFAEARAEARKAAGLNEAEVRALSEIQMLVLTSSLANDPRVAAQAAQLEKALASMPPQARTEAEKSLAALKTVQVDVRMKQARGKYGDAIIDAMLAQEATLRRQTKQLSESMHAP